MHRILDTKKPSEELGEQPKGQADYVRQDGIIFCWSESNLQYEQAWWLYLDMSKITEHTKEHVANILRDRPLPTELSSWFLDGERDVRAH